MLEEEDLSSNVLNFLNASFGFDRVVPLGGTEFVLFTRRETESEAKLRPKLIRRWVLVPKDWVVLDRSQDILRVARDGRRAGPSPGTLPDISSEAVRPGPRFTERGIEFTTTHFPGDLEIYIPSPYTGTALDAEGRNALGLPPPLEE